jgi:hypothetical protein
MTSPDPLSDQLSMLLDRTAIKSVLARYCQAVDRCDAGAALGCFHDDAEIHHGPFSGTPLRFLDHVTVRLRELAMTQHSIGSVDIELDGSRARAVSAFQAVHIRPGTGARRLETFWGRWCDHFERRQLRWAVVRRTVVHDGSESRILESAMPGSGHFLSGRRDSTDESYRRFPELRPGSADQDPDGPG